MELRHLGLIYFQGPENRAVPPISVVLPYGGELAQVLIDSLGVQIYRTFRFAGEF